GQALANIENLSPIDEQVWPDVFMDIIRPLIRNMRDVRRYAATAHGTVRSFNRQIKLVDLLALEAIRMFLPDVFKFLHSAIDGLTGSNSISQVPHLPDKFLQKQIDSLIEVAGDHSDVVKSMVTQLFPAGGHHIGGRRYGNEWKKVWLKERRVAHEDILRLYLECLENKNPHASIVAKKAWKHLANRNDLDAYLNSINPLRLQNVIASLEVFEEQFAREHVVPGTVVLLNLLPLPDQQRRGMFDLSPKVTVIRVIYRLLRSLNDPAEVETKLKDEIIPELKSLSSELALINIVGYQEGVGHRLVPEGVASKFEKEWNNKVRTTPVNNLVNEYDLLEVLLRTKRATKDGSLKIDRSPQLTLALLETAQRERWVREEGNRTIQRISYLAGDDLVELYSDQATLKERIDDLRNANLDDANNLIRLAEQYLDTYRDGG
ncbi:MAG: NTPase KAP, partial [Gammaproteobacteria bacterium]|nr:NTPase KAP [Gammaproteobacteria bacterium]